MTIASKLQMMLDTKAAIRLALENKGSAPTDVFSEYPTLIDELASVSIATPKIIAPLDGATSVDQSPIITASRFSGIDPDGFAEDHSASIWDFASDPEFTDIIHSSGRDKNNLESYNVRAAGVKFDGITLYVRVTYEGISGNTSVSSITSFTTTDMAIGKLVGGDVVFAQRDGYWLLVAGANRRVLRKWGLYNISVPATNPNTSGTYNTDILTSETFKNRSDGRGSIGCPAAEYCRSLGPEYFLPNENEAADLANNVPVIDAADQSSGTKLYDIFYGPATPSNGYRAIWMSLASVNTASARARRISDSTSGDRDFDIWVTPCRKIAV